MKKKIEDRGFTFCIQAKPNRRVKNNPLPQTRWKKWWELFAQIPRVTATAAKTLNQKPVNYDAEEEKCRKSRSA